LEHFPAIHFHEEAFLSCVDPSKRIEFGSGTDRDYALYFVTEAAIA
jgi:hypothetical protein